ncbi:MAG: carboxypeptidase regulatory-like domain-containing protein [Acidobacteriota bacterium]
MNKRTILAAATALALTVAFTAFLQGQGGGQGQAGQGQQNGGGQAQAQAPAGPPGAVAGQVVSATSGEPLRKVSLSLRPSGRGGTPASATSDNSGAFRFNTVDPGTYTLIGERPGYVRAAYGEDSTGQARQITVASTQTAGAIQLKLLPHSVIAGKVFDQDGDPIQSANVQVWRYTYPRGQRQLTSVDQSSTNDLGEFRVPGLAPGRYYVSAAQRGGIANLQVAIADLAGGGGFGGAGGAKGGGPGGNRQVLRDQILGRGGDANPENYVTTYFPRSVDPTGATPIDLVPGSEMRGVDIGLLKARLFTISGIVEGIPAAPPAVPQAQGQPGQGKNKQKGGQGGPGAVFVSLVPRNAAQQPGIGNALGGNAPANADGSFEFRGVQPGAYYIMAQSRGGQQQTNRLSARLSVDVSSGDLKSLRVRLAPPLEVTGKVVPDKTDSTINYSNIRLNFTSSTPAGQGGRGGGGQPRIDLAADGKFATTLDSDTYTVEIAGAPAGYYLKAVKLSGREAPDNRVDLTFSGAVLEVVLANDSGSITGKVEKSNGDPVQSARVTVVPANNSTRRDLYKSATSGADGTFTLSSLPPGSYRLYAWEEVEANAWMDLDFRRPFETLGSSATIKDGAGPNVTMRLIGREQMRLAGVQ